MQNIKMYILLNLEFDHNMKVKAILFNIEGQRKMDVMPRCEGNKKLYCMPKHNYNTSMYLDL